MQDVASYVSTVRRLLLVRRLASRRSLLAIWLREFGLLHVRFHKLGGGFFGVAANLANHDHGLGLRIAIEQVERVDEIRADNRIPADADGGRLSNAALGELMHRFVGQRAGARDDADGS